MPESRRPSKAVALNLAVGDLPITGPNSQARPKSVLVVDDHDLVRGLIVEILENAGLNVLQANNGLDALNQVQMHGATIGVILQDMSMPGMSGPETIVETLSLMPGANIIVLSVDEEHVVRQELGDIPVTGCLEKPCDADVLINSVKPYIV